MIVKSLLAPVSRTGSFLSGTNQYYFASTAERLVYSAKFIAKKRPNIEFEIKPISSENLTEVAREGAKILTDSEPLSSTLHFSYDEAVKFFTFLTFSNVQKNLGIACYNKTDNEFAAAILNEDFYDPVTNRQEIVRAFDQDEVVKKKMETIVDLYKIFGREAPQYYAIPKGPLEVIHLIAGITSPNYRGLGLMTRLTRFMIHEHPLIRRAKVIVTEASFPGSRIAFERNGFKNVAQIHYSDFKLSSGEKAFPKLNSEIIDEGLGPVQIMAFERKFT